MYILLSPDKTISEIQDLFTGKYPYLKLQFYKRRWLDKSDPDKKISLPRTGSLKAAGLKQSGIVDVKNDMTVGALENALNDQFGLNVQVARKSGTLWLETTMTGRWSLQKQNEHGREISLPAPKPRLEHDQEIDEI